MLAADQIILSMIANSIFNLHGKAALQHLGIKLSLANSVNKNTTHNALKRLNYKNIITKIEYGIYQFEDKALVD